MKSLNDSAKKSFFDNPYKPKFEGVDSSMKKIITGSSSASIDKETKEEKGIQQLTLDTFENENTNSEAEQNKNTNEKVENNMITETLTQDATQDETLTQDTTQNDIQDTQDTTDIQDIQDIQDTQDTTDIQDTTEKDKKDKKGKGKGKEDENNGEQKTKEVIVPTRTTRLEKNNQTKTLKFLYRNREKLKFDLAIQRNEVWTQAQKDNLIDSIIYGYPVPPVMVMETEDGNFWFLDGKQRGTTIVSFIANEWALSKKAKPVLGVNVAGKKFSELPEEFQDFIYEETITLIKLKGLTPQERDEMFVRWNSGSVLSKIELTRAKHSELIAQVNELSELEFFAEDIAMTNTGRNRFQDQEVILQIAMLLEKGRDGIKGFGSKEIDEYVMDMKKEDKILDANLVEKLKSVSTYMNMTSSDLTDAQKKKILKKASVPVIFYQAVELLEEKIKPSVYAEFLIDFLDTNYDKESEYGQTMQSSVSKRDNVVTRISALQFAFNEFLDKIKSERNKKDIYKTTAK